MCAEKWTESPKFNPNLIYTKEEFVFNFEVLLTLCTPGDHLYQVCTGSILWAESLKNGTKIEWLESIDGSLVPNVVSDQIEEEVKVIVENPFIH